MYSDINLIPKREDKIPVFLILCVTLSILLIVSFVGIYGVYDPLQEKQGLEERLKDKQKLTSSFQNLDARYNEANQVVNRYVELNKSISELLSDSFKMSDIVTAVEESLPENSYVVNFNYSNNNISLLMSSINYSEVADFIVNLRKVDFFTDIKYSYVTLVDEVNTIYNFDISFVLDYSKVKMENETEE